MSTNYSHEPEKNDIQSAQEARERLTAPEIAPSASVAPSAKVISGTTEEAEGVAPALSAQVAGPAVGLGSTELTAAQMDWLLLQPLMDQWHKRARDSSLAHDEMAKRFKSGSKWTGYGATGFGLLSGTSGLGTYINNFGAWGAFASLFFGGMAAFLSQLQTQIKHAEMVASHMSASASYAAVRRELEAEAPLTRGDAGVFSDKVRTKLDELAKSSPQTDKRALDRAKKIVGDDYMPLLHRPLPGRPQDWGTFNALMEQKAASKKNGTGDSKS